MRYPLLFILLMALFTPLTATELSGEQKQRLERLLPGIEVTDHLIDQLSDVFYTREMPVRSRLKAISKMVGLDQMPPGSTLERKICIWDIGGRNGPVFQAAMEQRALAPRPCAPILFRHRRNSTTARSISFPPPWWPMNIWSSTRA